MFTIWSKPERVVIKHICADCDAIEVVTELDNRTFRARFLDRGLASLLDIGAYYQFSFFEGRARRAG